MKFTDSKIRVAHQEFNEPLLIFGGAAFLFVRFVKEVVVKTITVSIESIVCDQQIMPQKKIDEDYVNELIEDLESDAVFPPVDLFHHRTYILETY